MVTINLLSGVTLKVSETTLYTMRMYGVEESAGDHLDYDKELAFLIDPMNLAIVSDVAYWETYGNMDYWV